MSMTEIVLSISFLSIITFIYRYSFISDQGRDIAAKIPQEFLRLLAPATFAAIIANNLVSHQSDTYDLKLKSIVAVLSLLIAYKTKSIMATLSFGLILLFILQNYVRF
jgi:branched-subunit amino acid transport protein